MARWQNAATVQGEKKKNSFDGKLWMLWCGSVQMWQRSQSECEPANIQDTGSTRFGFWVLVGMKRDDITYTYTVGRAVFLKTYLYGLILQQCFLPSKLSPYKASFVLVWMLLSFIVLCFVMFVEMCLCPHLLASLTMTSGLVKRGGGGTWRDEATWTNRGMFSQTDQLRGGIPLKCLFSPTLQLFSSPALSHLLLFSSSHCGEDERSHWHRLWTSPSRR